MELLLTWALLVALVTVPPCVVTVLVLRYITTRQAVLSPEWRALGEALANFVESRTVTAGASGDEAVPDEIINFAARESETWAREGIIARARELYDEYYDGRSPSGLIWARVLARLQQDAGETSTVNG